MKSYFPSAYGYFFRIDKDFMIMITREEVLFHETFGAIFNEYASGLLVYEPKGKKEMFIISESITQEELLELQIKSLNDNFDYVYELVKNNKQFVYEPGMIY